MLALGKLLEPTSPVANRRKIQLTVGGVMRWLSEGALEVRPPQAQDIGSDLLLSSGIHGNETAPIELLDRLHGIARAGDQARTRILFLFGNPGGDASRRALPRTGRQPAVQRPSRKNIGPEAMRAAELEQLARSFFSAWACALHYDLHTAIRGSKIEQFALYPGKRGASIRAANWSACAPPACKRYCCRTRPITFTAFTYEQLDAEAFTLELGKARRSDTTRA
jgi:succinylglutamate desuccinylase